MKVRYTLDQPRSWNVKGATYVVPSKRDVSKLDIEFFNVDYLMAEGYHKMAGFPVIITAGRATQVIKIAADIGRRGGEVTHIYDVLPMLAATLPLKSIGDTSRALQQSPYTEKIWLDRKVHVNLDVSVRLIGAQQVWDTGYRGEGVEIAILDTGVDGSHPDLDDLDDDPSTNDPKILQARDFTDDGTTQDLVGHGTHVAGTAAGTGEASSGLYTGVAPGANLYRRNRVRRSRSRRHSGDR